MTRLDYSTSTNHPHEAGRRRKDSRPSGELDFPSSLLPSLFFRPSSLIPFSSHTLEDTLTTNISPPSSNLLFNLFKADKTPLRTYRRAHEEQHLVPFLVSRRSPSSFPNTQQLFLLPLLVISPEPTSSRNRAFVLLPPRSPRRSLTLLSSPLRMDFGPRNRSLPRDRQDLRQREP